MDTAFNVLDSGAQGDGTTDNTLAFQTALDKVAATGGIVWIPPGQYRLNGTLSVPEGVALEGVWRGPHSYQLNKGSTLLIYAGRDQEDSQPFINLDTGSTLKGVTLFYPEQEAANIHPYPWTIQVRGKDCNVLDIVLANAYNGIDCGTYHHERHHLRNVNMCALRRGVLIDRCTDIGRVENVHIHNVFWWRVSPPYTLKPEDVAALERYTTKNLQGFIFGRTDWEYMSNCFVIWARIGWHFIKSPHPLGDFASANVLVTQSGSDTGPLAVRIDELQPHVGVAFENCQFYAGFEVGLENRGSVKLTNCAFVGWPEAGSQLVLDGQGTVSLTACHFKDWDQKKPCIQASNGSLLMNGCDFLFDEAPATPPAPLVYLGKEVKSAAILGNRFRHGVTKVMNDAQGDVQIMGNVGF